MSWTTVINNVSYTSPDPGENFWGDQVKAWMQAVGGTGAGQGGMLKKDGGLFQLLSEANFGTAFGIKALTYTSGSAAAGSAAGAGVVRLKRADVIGWRNEADSANLALSVSSSNWIQWQGVDLADISSAQTLTNKTMSGSSNTFTNIGLSSIVAPAAGVVISNGSLISSETRLSLARTADGTANYVLVAGGASVSPAYALIVNANVSASAAIARSKLAVGTADHVVINSGTGAFSSEAQLAVSRGGTGLGSLGTANQMLGVDSGATANEYKTLAVGTSGTDFAIAHSAGTVTFNLPTASASNRGALSTADWSTFNAKIGGSGNNGQVALFNGGSSLTSSSNIAYNLGSNANNIVLTSGIKIGMNTTVAATAGSGSIRYNAGVLEYSDGASWIALAASAGGILAINGLTPASQFLAVGTAGTDFAIVDAVDTHTFNLPTASGTNRGALSSADWTTFNNKQAAGNYITALTGDVTASGPGSVAATVAVIGGVTVSGATGSTNVVFSNSPTLVTPTLGVASATSINKVAITAPATSATLTIADGKTLTASNTLTFTGTDASSVAFGTGGTVVYANVTTLSSLVSVGTITTGVWNAGAVTSSGAVTGTNFVVTGSSIPANGIYLNAANNVGVATNSALRWYFNSTGELRGDQSTNNIIGRNNASNQNSNIQIYGSDSQANGAFIGLYGVTQGGGIEYRIAPSGSDNQHVFYDSAGAVSARISSGAGKDTLIYGQTLAVNTTTSAPGFSFENKRSTGMHNPTSDNLSLVINTTERLRSNDSGIITMSAYGAGTATFDASGNISSVSDARAKNNIVYEGIPGLEAILKIKPAYYNLNSETQDCRSQKEKYRIKKVKNRLGEEEEVFEEIPWTPPKQTHRYLGFIAQDLLDVIPNAVGMPQEEGGMYGFMDRPIIAALVEAVKELKAQLEVLQRMH